MAYVHNIYDENFLEYASYVIKDRAIPHIDDGLKPVQRRIIHSLLELDDGKFHKVANVVGHTMKYHPHGDQSIYSALVVIANKDLLIEKQGNFGNIYTGDEASAARYIECRLLPLTKEVLYNPEITQFVDSYDGRNKEPVAFPAKVPIVLAHGAEGIAVGMSTKILPHNFIELLEAQINCLRNEEFTVYPDFPTGGLVDVSEYEDGNGKVVVRARLDTKDPKRIIIREIPYGTTTESLINSIEAASKKNHIKVSSINDYTAENVEIEVRLARNVKTKDVVDALYAFTNCENSISTHLMIINRDNRPQQMTVTEVIKYSSERLVEILTAELNIEKEKLRARLHAKTIEQIFIENRIYKLIEEEKTKKNVQNAVIAGLEPFKDKIKRDVTSEDVETLLKIPIRRISLYDINKAKKEMSDIRRRLREIREALSNITEYSIDFLRALIEIYRPQFPRRTEIKSIDKVDARAAAKRDLKLCYDRETGYLGYSDVEGTEILDVSEYDRVLVIRKNGEYSVIDVPEKLFVGKGMLYCGFVDKDVIFNVLYKEKKTSYPYIKRCRIDKFILNKEYSLVPDGCVALKLTTDSSKKLSLQYKHELRMRVLDGEFSIADYPVRGLKARGLRIAKKKLKSAKFV